MTSLLNDIINLKSNLTGSVCNLQKVSKQFAAIAKILGESSAAFVALCEGIGITPGDPDSTLTTFKSANATSNALSMATEYVDCLNSLGAAAIALRATPPLLANYQELLAFVTNAKDMFTSLQQVTVFFMEQFKASSTTKLLCDKCEAFDSPPSPPDESTIVVPDIPSESDIVDDFDEVLNVLSHPGCCTYLADTAVDSANLLKGLSLALSRLSNFEQIVLHSSQEQAFFTCLDTLLGQLNELSASVSATATQQESAPESYCINHGLIPFVNKINEDATHINASVVELIQLLGGGSFDLSGIEALEVNRRTPGCEMLLEALKHCTTSMQECVSFAHIICQKLLNTSRRRLNPPLLGKLGAVGSALQSIGTHLSEIKDKISSEETLCYFCNKPNVSKAFGEFVEHFSDFTNVCFSGSESSINGILARYCSSMANIIATQTVQRVQHIQEIVQSITEDDAIFAFTMNDAVIPFLNEVRDSYIALYETQLPEKGISCGADAQIAILKTLDNCVADFQQKLLNLAGFISRETFFPPLFFTTYYQLEPDLTALVCQSFDKIYKSISQMAFKMQRKEVIYANNQRIVDVLTSIKNAPLSNLISRAYNVFACDYCNYSTSQIIPESEKVEGAISSVISASMYPTNLIAMKEVGLKIAIKAKEINKICEEFINNNSVTLAINEDLKSQLRMLGNSLYGARSFLHDTLKDQNGELTVDGIKYLHDHSATPLHEAVSSFVSMLNISWSSDANESVLREIDIENQLKLFFSAVANVATSLNIMLNVAKNAGQITYDHELVQTLDQVVTEINAMPAIALVTLHEHPIPFVESCAQFAETLHALQTTLADIVEELRRKCCSTFFPHVRNLSHGLQRFFIFLNEIVYSEQYKKMLIDPDAQHELLAYLCDPSSRPVDDGSAGGDSDDSPINPDAPTEIYSGLTGVNRELQKLLTLQSTTGDDCLTREITPTLERLTNIVNEAADVCKSFYTIHKIGVALADLPPPPSDAILCANNVMDEIVETLGHLKLISDYLNNIRYEPGYSLNSGLSAFDTLFSVLAQISENVEHLGRANLVLCPRCVSWPQIHIAAMAASLKPAHVDVKKEAEVNCCASFARETHIFAHWAEQLERAHDTLLTGFESKISPPNCFSIERKDVIDFTKIIQKFTEHSDKLYDPFIEMIALVNQYAVNNESCLAVICLPKMRSANDAILELLKFVHYTNGNATLKTPKFDAQFDCENRSLNIGAIIGSFNRILNRWYEFMNQWNTVLTLYEHFDFSQSFHKFEEVTVRLRQGISDWGEANYASGHPVFCLKCEEYIEPIRFENLMNTTWISNVFEEIIEKSDNCCSSVLQLTVCNIRKNMSNITNALYSASAYSEFENPYFTELIQRGPTFWTNLLAGLENFVATVLELKTLSFHAPCPDKVLNPVLMRLWNNVKKIQSAFGVQDEAVIPQKPFNNDVVDLANDFENLSVAWNSFCCAIDKNAPDKNRIDIANAMKRVNDNLTILYDNIASFKVLMNVNFCGGESITVDITPNLTETTRRIIFRTARLLPSLWAHNCCDVHAKCIYNAGKYLEHIDATINTEAVTNGSIRDDTCDKLCECLSALSVMINAFQYKVNTSVELGEDVHCVFLEAAEEFGQIQEALEQATSINPTPLSYPDWDAFTSSTRNDCESLGDLYRDLRQKLNMTFNTLLTQLEHKEVPVILGIYSGVDSVHAALTDAAEIMQRCEIARGSLCQSCQHRDVLRGINLIIEELNVARERLSLMARCPILQETQATYADSSRMIDLFFGQPNASRREGWTPLEAVRQSAIEANRAAAAFVKDLLRPAVVVNV
ncbi:MAG: hypothetical protein LBQ43_03260 [Holosporales bacterium]|nr:hypothetical protein [Holosporales bacterium]